MNREEPLWLVVVRIGEESRRRRGGGEPWRLLTNEPVETEEECWRIAEAYASRWQVEQMLRYNKSELGIESIRIRKWEGRRKLLAINSLAYAFLVEMVGESTGALLKEVLRRAHRTGRQAQSAWRPITGCDVPFQLSGKVTPQISGVLPENSGCVMAWAVGFETRLYTPPGNNLNMAGLKILGMQGYISRFT